MIHNSNFTVHEVLLEHSHTLGDCCCCPVTKSCLTLHDRMDAAQQACLPISSSLFRLMSIWVGEAIQPSHPFYVICPGCFSNLRSCSSGLHSLCSSPWLIPKHARPRPSLTTTTAPHFLQRSTQMKGNQRSLPQPIPLCLSPSWFSSWHKEQMSHLTSSQSYSQLWIVSQHLC